MKITKRKLKFFKIMLLNPDEMFESNMQMVLAQMISTYINIRNNCTLQCALLKKEGGGEHMPSMAVFTSLVFSFVFVLGRLEEETTELQTVLQSLTTFLEHFEKAQQLPGDSRKQGCQKLGNPRKPSDLPCLIYKPQRYIQKMFCLFN